MSAGASPASPSAPDGAPVVVGHRGAAALAPENTLASFARALADGAAAIECDVHLSADGQVVVMHDPSIDRTADPASPVTAGRIAEMTRAELDRVLLPGGEPVPSLAQVLDLCAEASRRGPGGAPQALIEVKAPEAASAVGRILRDRPGPQVPALVISFYPEALAALRESAPGIPIGLLVDRVEESTEGVLDQLGAEVLSVSVAGVEPADGRAAHEAGRLLNVWTVNEEEQLRRALAAGADSITSDDPGWVRARFAKLAAEHPGTC